MKWGMILRGLLTVGERESFLELRELIKLSREANSAMKEMFTVHEKLSFEVAAENIRDLEKKADDVAFKIKQDIMSGAVGPNILGNLLECVDVADSLVDDYYYLSRELIRMVHVRSAADRANGEEALDRSEFSSLFLSFLDLADETSRILEKLLAARSMNEMTQLRKNIQNLEEEGDNIKDHGFDELYKIGDKIPYVRFVHYTELLHRFDDVLDGCEDLSDLVLSIVTTISR